MKIVNFILSFGFSGSEYHSVTIVPPKVSTSEIGRSAAISNDALHNIALTGSAVDCDSDWFIKSDSDQPPDLPVMIETGPSSACVCGVTSTLEQLARSRVVRTITAVRIYLIL